MRQYLTRNPFISFILFIGFFSSLLLISFPAYAIGENPPTISLLSPQSGDIINQNLVAIKGSVVDDATASNLITIEISDETMQVIGNVSPDTSGNWSYSHYFNSGSHTLSIKATDELGKTQESTVQFKVDLRPSVSPITFPSQDMTRVPLDTQISIALNDDFPITNILIDANNKPIILTGKDAIVEGSASFDKVTQKITFIPSSPLSANSKYQVEVSPNITDDSGNKIYPRTWRFTTTNNQQNSDDPHGNYNSNVNTCVNCHSTHVAEAPGLVKNKIVPTKPSVDNYCMACHDGTVAPMPYKMNETHAHDITIESDQKMGSCTGCHNPHLTWTEENPLLLKDHYTYPHPSQPDPPETFDSANVLCEKCHVEDVGLKKIAPGVTYSPFHYRKSSTATGVEDDFALCLRCHDGSKASDIKKFYRVDSGSRHNLTAVDGSPLRGQIPCAECHSSHGSANIKILRSKVGHENQAEPFSVPSGEWDAAAERQFCLKCHNASTALYGVPAGFDTNLNEHKPAVAPETDPACSSCHSDSYDPDNTASFKEAFMEAAHAPK